MRAWMKILKKERKKMIIHFFRRLVNDDLDFEIILIVVLNSFHAKKL